MKTLKNGFKILTDGETLPPETPAILAAQPPDGGQYESEYVGDAGGTIATCQQYMAELKTDPEWAGWNFQIWADDGDGCYCVLI